MDVTALYYATLAKTVIQFMTVFCVLTVLALLFMTLVAWVIGSGERQPFIGTAASDAPPDDSRTQTGAPEQK